MASDQVAAVLSTHTGILRGVVDRLEDLDARLGGSARRPASTGGFAAPGEYLAALRRQESGLGDDPRLMLNAVTTFGGTTVGADGGFAIPPTWGEEVLRPAVGPGSLLSAFDPVYEPTAMLSIAVDQAAPWSAGGVAADLTAEGGAISGTKPVLKKINAILYNVPALVHASDQISSDSAAYGRHLWRSLGTAITNRIEQLIINGTGENQPLGFLRSPSLVTVTPTDSTATAISATDVRKMISRLLPSSFGSALWVASPSAVVALMSASDRLYNANGASPYGYGTLAGRPIAVSAHMAVLGTTGDVALLDPRAFLYGLNGPRTAATIAFAFDRQLSSYRASVRVGGVPLLSAAVPPLTGTDTLTTTVALGTRP